MKNTLKFRINLLFLTLFLCIGTPILSSCGSSKGAQASEQGDKKKQKAKKCPEESCQVRMTHYHEGSKFKGKRGCFFVKLFTPKESKYGQGLHRNHGNPGSKKRKRK